MCNIPKIRPNKLLTINDFQNLISSMSSNHFEFFSVRTPTPPKSFPAIPPSRHLCQSPSSLFFSRSAYIASRRSRRTLATEAANPASNSLYFPSLIFCLIFIQFFSFLPLIHRSGQPASFLIILLHLLPAVFNRAAPTCFAHTSKQHLHVLHTQASSTHAQAIYSMPAPLFQQLLQHAH